MNKKKFISILILPFLLFGLYFGLKSGYISPMVKALDIQIIGGTFITNVNQYVIKVGDEVNVSPGKYIVVPNFAKHPELKFVILDNHDVLSINGRKITAKKEGHATIGIMTKNRVLRKATVMVVNPVIKKLELDLDTNIKYYGDKSKIISTVDIDEYKSLEKGYKLKYTTSDPKILKVTGNYVEAVGVGQAKLISSYDRKEIQKTLNVLPRVDNIEVNQYFEVEKEKTININPKISTSPNNANSSVHYKVLDDVDQKKYDVNKIIIDGESGIRDDYGIIIDKNGDVKGNRVGTYNVVVSSGNKSVNTSVEVKKQDFGNIKIKNLQYRIDKKTEKLAVEIGWDYNEEVNSYRVYVKKDDEDFKLYTTISTNKNIVPSGKRLASFVNFDEGNKFQIKVVGTNGADETEPSNIISIEKNASTEFQSKKVESLDYNLDSENRLLYLKWKPIDNKKYTYRVYFKNKKSNDDRYVLTAKNINDTSVTLRLKPNIIDYEFYVVAVNEKGQISDYSKGLSIYSLLSE